MTRTVISGAINGNWVARDEIISSLNKNSIIKTTVANEQKIRNSMSMISNKTYMIINVTMWVLIIILGVVAYVLV